jgi:light-regulated signal transduction histidine kinase (bacteriophytochrome)
MRIYAQMLERRWRDRIDPESEQFLKFISEAAGRMSALVADVLALSRASEQATEPAELVDLNDVLAQVRSNLQASIAETGAVISGDSLPVVFSNAAEMVQLLQNLIGNALKYRREDMAPDIRLSSSRHDGLWEITVEDNGIGIRPEYAETVFLPFRRLHGREIPGTGIGLALCRRIVERHGGRIWVVSARNGGSAFHFTVPVQRTSDDTLS